MRDIAIILIALAILIATFVAEDNYQEHYRQRGIAISNFLAAQYNMDVPPDWARYFNVVVTTTDVQLSIEQFKVFEGGD